MLFGYNQSNFEQEIPMNKYIFLILLSFFSIFLTACTTKIDKSIDNSNIADVSALLTQLAQKEKEMNDIIKELEQCGATKKIEE